MFFLLLVVVLSSAGPPPSSYFCICFSLSVFQLFLLLPLFVLVVDETGPDDVYVRSISAGDLSYLSFSCCCCCCCTAPRRRSMRRRRYFGNNKIQVGIRHCGRDDPLRKKLVQEKNKTKTVTAAAAPNQRQQGSSQQQLRLFGVEDYTLRVMHNI